jgi:hypothetical protein
MDGMSLMAVMMETLSTSETSVSFYKTTRRHMPESAHLDHRFNIRPTNFGAS